MKSETTGCGHVLHELKTWPGPFRDIKRGAKTFEYRKNDRGYQEGDDLLLREWAPDSGYTGAEALVSVPHLIRGPDFGIQAGFVCMSVKPYTWKLCDLCNGVAHDPDPEGWGEPCDNCAGHGGKWVRAESHV